MSPGHNIACGLQLTIVAMFPGRWGRGTGTRDASRRLAKIRNNGDIHLSKDYSIGGTRPNQFRDDEPSAIQRVEECVPLLVGSSGR